MTSNSFYVYLHRTESGQVFYVGKGQGNRAWSKKNRNISWRRTASRQGLVVELLYEGLPEKRALELEIETIAYYGRENLVNLTDGGEGVSGRKVSEESRAKMRERKLGRKFTVEHCANLSKAKLGKAKPPRTPEHRARLREVMPGRQITCSNGQTFAKIKDAEAWLREKGFPKASVGGLHTAAKNKRTAYGFSWKFQNV